MTAFPATPPAAGAPIPVVQPLLRLFATEGLLFVREPAAIISALVFPVFLALILGATFGDWKAVAGYRIVDVNAPALMAVVAANLALMGLPIAVTDYKERGILKRYQASPMPAIWLLAVLHLVGLVVLLAGSALIVVATLVAFGLRFGGNPLSVLLLLVLASTALNSFGFALGGVLPTTRQAQAVGFCLFFPMLFLSGATFPTERFPEALQVVSQAVPLTYVVDALAGVWTGESLLEQWPALLVLLGITLASIAVARATFKWS